MTNLPDAKKDVYEFLVKFFQENAGADTYANLACLMLLSNAIN